MANPFKDHELSYGPDLLRPASRQSSRLERANARGVSAFIYTKYGYQGQHLFVEPAEIGHEHISTRPEVIQAMFGPELASIQSKISYDRPTYSDEPDPVTRIHKQTGSVKDYDQWEVRRHALTQNLFGRYGYVRNQPVIMLWNSPENWQQMLSATIAQLKVAPETTIVSGGQVIGTAAQFNQDHVADDKEKERMQLLAQYHTAIGDKKAGLKKQLGLDKIDTTPNNNKRPHWRRAGRQAGLDLFSYGEATLSLPFAAWLTQQETLR